MPNERPNEPVWSGDDPAAEPKPVDTSKSFGPPSAPQFTPPPPPPPPPAREFASALDPGPPPNYGRPTPEPEHRGFIGRTQFYMALVMAAVLGGMVAAGIVAFTDITFKKETAVAYQAPLGAERVKPNERLTANAIYRLASPGTVFIETFDGLSGGGSGSGFVIDSEDGYIITNEHVVDGAAAVDVTFQNRKRTRAKVVGTDPSLDLALLEVDANRLNLHALELANSDGVAEGDPVAALGAPFGLDRTLTTGIVSATGRTITSPNGFPIRGVLQTDAAINPGNSGGPLLDAGGRVIGVNSQIATQSSSFNGIGFAVPSNTVSDAIEDLKAGGVTRHGYLGISGVAAKDIPASVGVRPRRGGYVAEVTEGGPADRAGLRGGEKVVQTPRGEYRTGGDVIIAIDGKATPEFEDISAVIADHEPGDVVELTIVRDGKEKTVRVKLSAQPTQAAQP